MLQYPSQQRCQQNKEGNNNQITIGNQPTMLPNNHAATGIIIHAWRQQCRGPGNGRVINCNVTIIAAISVTCVSIRCRQPSHNKAIVRVRLGINHIRGHHNGCQHARPIAVNITKRHAHAALVTRHQSIVCRCCQRRRWLGNNEHASYTVVGVGHQSAGSGCRSINRMVTLPGWLGQHTSMASLGSGWSLLGVVTGQGTR